MLTAVISFRFGAEDLLRTRFAMSPLFELLRALRLAYSPRPPGVLARWVPPARERLGDDLDLRLLRSLIGESGYSPDFLAPPPRSPVPDVAEELARLRATPPEQVARELGWRYPRGGPALARPLLADTPRVLAALADLMAELWSRLLAPDWPAIRAVLEADVEHRGRALMAGGSLEVFRDLHPAVRWSRSALRVDRPYDATVDLAGRGLLLIPVAFGWPEVATMIDPPWQPALLYPPRGVGTLWAPRAERDLGAIGALIGERRARLLAALDAPAATIDLAGRLRASPAGVSEHLGVLRRAGLVTARRAGRRVVYARSPAGDALLAAAE
jgi:DNA-binding transcriptional ArsR family regulator